LKQDYLQMRVLELAPQVYVSGQLFEHDVRLMAKQGVRSIMNNRPDGESMGQPLSAKQDVEEFAKACDELERPLLIFCRSGARSTTMWEMAESM